MKEIRQTKEYADYLKSQGWIIEKINSDFIFIKKIPLLGSVIKYQRPENFNLNKFLAVAKKHRSFYLVLELKNTKHLINCKQKGFKVINPFLPSKTLMLDISKPNENIVKNFDKDARYSIRKTQNKKIIEEINLTTFQANWKNTAARGRYILSVNQLKNFKKYFDKNMILLTNENGSSGAMFLIADKIGYYWYGYTSNAARATLIQYKIIFEGIKWAKKHGAKKFDFEGIYDDRFPNTAWKGFTVFKKKFGGKEVKYPPALGKYCLRNVF